MNAIEKKIKELEKISQITLNLADPKMGEKARAKREALEITQLQLSKKTGVPVSTIQRIESCSGSVRIKACCSVVNYLNEL